MQTNRVSKNKLVGYCEIDLLEFLAQVNNLIIEWLLTANILKSLAYMLKVSLFLSCQALDKKKKKRLSFWFIYLQGNLDDFELWWKNVTIVSLLLLIFALFYMIFKLIFYSLLHLKLS